MNSIAQNYNNSLLPTAHTMSDASLRLRFEADERRRKKLMLRLTSTNDSYAGFWVGLQGLVYDLLQTAKLDNPRAQEMRKEHQYKLFTKEFSNVPVEN